MRPGKIGVVTAVKWIESVDKDYAMGKYEPGGGFMVWFRINLLDLLALRTCGLVFYVQEVEAVGPFGWNTVPGDTLSWFHSSCQ